MPDRKIANRIACVYGGVGALWIVAGSRFADTLFGGDMVAHGSFELFKGLFFIGVTAVALRWLLLGELRRRSQTETELIQATTRLSRMLDQVVEALSHTLEQRDPYTAGHQERVAALSVAIARRMGLPEARIAAVRTGALLHDIGKIGIPAELLAKPGRLSVDEFNLVKGHARMGREIVSRVAFDDAVHAVVAQHHERLDGSGYPDGLRGDDITLEARIVAVADVVEAMTSHRPYRAALGLGVAEAEIRNLRGDKLDAAAVDACLEIIERGPQELNEIWRHIS